MLVDAEASNMVPEGLDFTLLMSADNNQATIVNTRTGQRLFQANPMDNVWVELSAGGSAAHGPALRIRLVSEQHSAVQDARAALRAASEADLAYRAQRAERLSQLPSAHQAQRAEKPVRVPSEKALETAQASAQFFFFAPSNWS